MFYRVHKNYRTQNETPSCPTTRQLLQGVDAFISLFLLFFLFFGSLATANCHNYGADDADQQHDGDEDDAQDHVQCDAAADSGERSSAAAQRRRPFLFRETPGDDKRKFLLVPHKTRFDGNSVLSRGWFGNVESLNVSSLFRVDFRAPVALEGLLVDAQFELVDDGRARANDGLRTSPRKGNH